MQQSNYSRVFQKRTVIVSKTNSIVQIYFIKLLLIKTLTSWHKVEYNLSK